MRFNQDHFRDRRGLLSVFIGLDMLSKLGHYGAELQMKLAEVTVSLKLCAELVVRLLVLVDRVVTVLGGEICAYAVIFIKVHRVLSAVLAGSYDAASSSSSFLRRVHLE